MIVNNSNETWVHYTVNKNPIAVMDIIEYYGYPEAEEEEDLLEATFHFMGNVPNATHILKKAHPDYELFSSIQKFPDFSEKKNFHNANNEIIKEDIQPKKIESERISTLNDSDKEFLKRAIIVGLVIIGVVQILKIMPNART